jgi:preprotein translocase subunit SecG
MSTLISVLIFIVCILLILVVLIQNSKGGGVSSSFGAPTQMMGVKKSAETIEKLTWGLAIALLLLSVFSASLNKSSQSTAPTESVTRQKASEAPVEVPASNQAPSAPMMPQQGQPAN